MKNKKGFTLVELLAVIAILAILVIMALPAVLRMFNQARIDTFSNEVNTIIRTTRQQYLLGGGEPQSFNSSSNKLPLTGNSSLEYCVSIDGNGKITELKATNGNYKYESSGIVDEVHSTEVSTAESNYELSCAGGNTSSITYVNRQNEGQITVGDEVAVDTEHFYVIGVNSTEVTLLSKYDLKSDESSSYVQDPSGNYNNILKVQFSSVGYWDAKQCERRDNSWSCPGATSGLISPYNENGMGYCSYQYQTNCAYVYDSNSNIKVYVDSYANKISTLIGKTVTGRLLKLEEAYVLKTSGHSPEMEDPNGGVAYWLGTANGNHYIWRAAQYGGILEANIDSTYAVRPVIVISTSEMPA